MGPKISVIMRFLWHKIAYIAFILCRFPDQKLHSLDSSQEIILLLRTIGSQRLHKMMFREYRPHLLADTVEYVPNSAEEVTFFSLKMYYIVHIDIRNKYYIISLNFNNYSFANTASFLNFCINLFSVSMGLKSSSHSQEPHYSMVVQIGFQLFNLMRFQCTIYVFLLE